jgi:hypothetical protein
MVEKFSAERALLPALVFVVAITAHYLWFVKTSTPAPSAGACCGSSCEEAPGIVEYLKTQTYLLGYSVALSLSFASFAIRRFLEQQSKKAKGAAFGGIGASAVLGFAGCYLTGCCGSPMLGVYIGLLGPSLLPFAKPLVAIITTISILLSARSLLKSKTVDTGCCDGENSCAAIPVAIDKASP